MNAYELEAINVGEEIVFPCLPASYPVAGSGACWHLRSARPVAKCDGCDRRRGVVATLDGEHYCAPCSVALCVFARAS